VKILSNKGDVIRVEGKHPSKLGVLKDDCYIKDDKIRHAVFQYTSSRPDNLPISDIAVFDVADSNEAFGLEIGPVCFS